MNKNIFALRIADSPELALESFHSPADISGRPDWEESEQRRHKSFAQGTGVCPESLKALSESFDAAVGERDRGRVTPRRNLIGGFLALSMGLHALFFAALFFGMGNDRPALPERRALQVSWVSISPPVAGATGTQPSPAARPVASGRPLLQPAVTDPKEVPVRFFSEPIAAVPTRMERDASPSLGHTAVDAEGSSGSAALPENLSAEETHGVAIAKDPSASGFPGAESPRVTDGVKPPRYLENAPPDYPAMARLQGYEGVVWLSVQVLPEGRVGDLRIKKSSGFDILDRAAARAVKTWRFEPATSMGNPVPMWVDLPIRFVLTEGALAS
jgi:protein TonB